MLNKEILIKKLHLMYDIADLNITQIYAYVLGFEMFAVLGEKGVMYVGRPADNVSTLKS